MPLREISNNRIDIGSGGRSSGAVSKDTERCDVKGNVVRCPTGTGTTANTTVTNERQLDRTVEPSPYLLDINDSDAAVEADTNLSLGKNTIINQYLPVIPLPPSQSDLALFSTWTPHYDASRNCFTIAPFRWTDLSVVSTAPTVSLLMPCCRSPNNGMSHASVSKLEPLELPPSSSLLVTGTFDSRCRRRTDQVAAPADVATFHRPEGWASISPSEANYSWSCQWCNVSGLKASAYWLHCLTEDHTANMEATTALATTSTSTGTGHIDDDTTAHGTDTRPKTVAAASTAEPTTAVERSKSPVDRMTCSTEVNPAEQTMVVSIPTQPNERIKPHEAESAACNDVTSDEALPSPLPVLESNERITTIGDVVDTGRMVSSDERNDSTGSQSYNSMDTTSLYADTSAPSNDAIPAVALKDTTTSPDVIKPIEANDTEESISSRTIVLDHCTAAEVSTSQSDCMASQSVACDESKASNTSTFELEPGSTTNKDSNAAQKKIVSVDSERDPVNEPTLSSKIYTLDELKDLVRYITRNASSDCWTCTLCQVSNIPTHHVKSHCLSEKHYTIFQRSRQFQILSSFVTPNDSDSYWTCSLCDIHNLQAHSVANHCLGKKHATAFEAQNTVPLPSSSSHADTNNNHTNTEKVPSLPCDDSVDPEGGRFSVQKQMDESLQAGPRFDFIHKTNNNAWSCKLCQLHGLSQKDVEPHCLGRRHTTNLVSYQAAPPQQQQQLLSASNPELSSSSGDAPVGSKSQRRPSAEHMLAILGDVENQGNEIHSSMLNRLNLFSDEVEAMFASLLIEGCECTLATVSLNVEAHGVQVSDTSTILPVDGRGDANETKPMILSQRDNYRNESQMLAELVGDDVLDDLAITMKDFTDTLSRDLDRLSERVWGTDTTIRLP